MTINDKQNNKSKIVIVVLIIILLIIVLLASCLANKNNNDICTTTTTINNNLDFTPAQDNDGKIKLPCMSGLNLKANCIKQTVDFYNPKENNCYFVIELSLSDGTLIWKSDYIKPKDRVTNIQLLRTLEKGTYNNCTLVYNCYSLDNKTPLNNGKVTLKIHSF